MAETCRLCECRATSLFAQPPGRRYFRCDRCNLVFLAAGQLPSRAEEQAEYALHQNDPDDQRYRKHLARLTGPLTAGLTPGAHGLDFGSGPGPAISLMLGESGFKVTNYDPIFAPASEVLDRRFEFISCTEVVEHFHHPGREFIRLNSLLSPGGRLGIMTQLLTDDIDFPSWSYRQEKSHVAFYSPATMHFIACQQNWRATIQLPNVVLFHG